MGFILYLQEGPTDTVVVSVVKLQDTGRPGGKVTRIVDLIIY
jgi:hypothetical protein